MKEVKKKLRKKSVGVERWPLRGAAEAHRKKKLSLGIKMLKTGSRE